MEVLGARWRNANELVFTFGGSYVCANFGTNRSRNATVRVPTDGHTDRLTDANRFYDLSHAICGTDNKNIETQRHSKTLHGSLTIIFCIFKQIEYDRQVL